MAFSFSNAAQGGGFVGQPASPSQPSAQDGPELKEIQTDVSVAFLHVGALVANSLTANRFPSDSPQRQAQVVTLTVACRFSASSKRFLT
jgi:hypothetical protein